MSTMEQIESAILGLPAADFRRLTEWLMDLDQRRWDEELDEDIAAGRLDALASEAMADYEAGRTKEICIGSSIKPESAVAASPD
jgi:hypothetical protein